MPDFLMPSLGADMQVGTLVRWCKQPGDHVSRGEIIAEVETEKGIIEVECFHSGVVEQIWVEPGGKVPVGEKLASIRAEGAEPLVPVAEPEPEPPPAERAAKPEPPPAERAAKPEPPPAERAAKPEPPPAERAAKPEPPPAERAAKPQLPHATPSARRALRAQGVAPEQVHGSGRHGTITRDDVAAASASSSPARSRVFASPLARRTAVERGVSLDDVHASGPTGYVVQADVLRARGVARRSAPADDMAGMRRAIAEAMARSKRDIPHYYLSQTVDLAAALGWLDAQNGARSVSERLLPGVLLLRAVTRALAKTPELNAHFEHGRATTYPRVQLGVAISLRGGGLIAPAIADADQLPIDALSRALKDLVSRARGGRLRSSEMGTATITVTSLGERGVEAVFPVIVPPQVAIVGFGTITPKPLAVAGEVVVRPSVTVTLAADHRVSDGHRGGLFLAAVQSLLQEPNKL